MEQQARQTRDSLAGVNLDNEATDLVRFQQAYQAAAKSVQIGTQLFEAVLNIR
jgi:flagellar hook-associated protein 1 FlgK